jgi:hypothetical protein
MPIRLSTSTLPYQRFFPAFAALSHKLEEVSAYFEACLLREPALQLPEVAIGKVNHGTAFGAYQVMVMLGRPSYQVAAAVPAGVQFTDKPKPGKYLKRAINRNQPDTGVLPAYPRVDFRRGKVLVTVNNGAYNRAALRGNFVAPLS